MEDASADIEEVAWDASQKPNSLWKHLSSAVDSPGFAEEHDLALTQLVFSTLTRYTALSEQQAVRRVLNKALDSEKFLKTFAAALVRGATTAQGSHECFVLLCWSALVLARLPLPGAKKAIVKLLECQAKWLDVLNQAHFNWDIIMRHMEGLLQLHEDLLQECSAVAVSTGSSGFIRALCHNPGRCNSLKSSLLPVYLQRVLGSRDRVSPEDLQAFVPLLRGLSQTEVAEQVLPPAVRMMKRSPESVLPTVAVLLDAVQVDLSQHAVQLGADLAPQIRHMKEPIRVAAVAVVQALAQKVSNAGILAQLLGSFQQLLDSKLRGIHERTGLINAVAALAVNRQSAASLAADAVTFLCSFYREEANEEAKLRTIVALGAWMQLLEKVPEAAISRLSDSFKEKDNLRRAQLRVLNNVLLSSSRKHAAAAYSPLASGLAQLVVEGTAKVARTVDGILAMLAAASIAADDSHTDKLLAQKVWPALSQPESLLAPAIQSRLAAEDSAFTAQLVQVLLLKHAHRLQSAAALHHTLIDLTLHHSAVVRSTACRAASACTAQNPQLLLPLIKALQHYLQSPSQVSSLADASSAQDDSNAPNQSIVSARFVAALLAIAPGNHRQLPASFAPTHSQENGNQLANGIHHDATHAPLQSTEQAEVIARIILSAHHDTIAFGRSKQRSAWGLVSRRFSPQASAWLQASPRTAVQYLFSTEAALAEDTMLSKAGCRALSCIMAEAAQHVWPEVSEALAKQLDGTQHDALSPNEICIFQTPEGEVALERDLSSVGAPLANGHVSSSRPVAPSKQPPAAAKRAGFADPKAKAAAGRVGAKAVKDPAAEMRQRQLAQEAEVRQQVEAIRQQLSRGLYALRGIALGNVGFTRAHLQPLAAFVQPLLASPLVGEEAAYEATAALAGCLPGALGKAAISVAAGLRIVELGSGALTGYDSSLSLPTHPAFIAAITALEQATVGSSSTPLSPPAYAFIFPLLKAVLEWPSHTALHDAALSVIALHVDPDGEVPRPASLRALFRVLDVLPAFRTRVDPLIQSLCEGLQPSEVAAALEGLLYSTSHVRHATLEALPSVPCIASGQYPDDDRAVAMLWMACHDPLPLNTDAALLVWSVGSCVLAASCVQPLTKLLAQPAADVRLAAADALATTLQDFPEAGPQLLESIIGAYTQQASQYLRGGIAMALNSSAPQWRAQDAVVAIDFLLSFGFAEPDDNVRSSMVDAGVALVDAHGADIAPSLLPLLEGYLDKSDVGDEASYDLVREGVVICLGTLARHLDPADPKVRVIIDTLMEVLATPSAEVQRAVSSCLPPLMPAIRNDRAYVEALLGKLLTTLMQGSSYGVRKGAAHGLAGVVKGLQIRALNEYSILEALQKGLDDSKNPVARQGALFGFECLCDKLGRLFEPYVVQLIGKLLEKFGDGSADVRAANDDAAKAVMAHLSSYGVKLVMPALLEAVDNKAWRSKQGSVQMLGAMAFCAPRQLATALPLVVPKLATLLSDPHPKVQAATQRAFRQVGSVIRNPEVSQLVPVLLAAIGDPNTAGKPALDTLLATTFVNTVDAASLALIVPVVHRAMRDRSGDMKKRAARIVGNMCQLINDPKDMAPYVPLIMPELQAALIDPLPEVRATAARAMGSLLRSMGDDLSKKLMPWLLQTLKSDGSSVERSGAAQGLAEALAALGRSHLDALLPSILVQCTNKSASVREGNLTLLKFLPLALPESFLEHLEEVLPAMLGGLADEAEGVREAALAAGRTMVELFADSALPLLLPAVETGVVHNAWRIRQSSVELLGDLLFKVAGTSGKIQQGGDEDTEGISSEAHAQAITEVLGVKRRNEVLARVYMARSDVGLQVRAAALHVWKTVVSNTPKMLAEILPALMDQLIASLASSGEERQQMASRCLGELVRKMGDRVLRVIVPILRTDMGSDSGATRQGVCYGLKELMDNVSRQQLAEHLSTLLPTLQGALLDPDAHVRTAAGAAFSVLFKGGAGSAVDSIIPSLLAGLPGPDKQHHQAVEGLRVILGVRPQSFGSMVPQLLRPPLGSKSLHALAALAEASGTAVHGHLMYIFPPLLTIASNPSSSPSLASSASDALNTVASTVAEDGVYLLIGQLDRGLEDPAKRRAAAAAITHFCKTTKHDFQEHIPQLLSSLAGLMGEEDPETLLACWTALSAVTATIPKEVAPSHVRCVKDAVGTAGERYRRKKAVHVRADVALPGFSLPKALAPLLPIYLQGLLQGSSTDLREMAAEGLGDLVRLTGADALKPFVVQITGPLIRILGDRFPWEIKAAILATLGLLIRKAGLGLKPFVPQLQTTFLKCLADQVRQVRQSAGENLGQLSALSARADALAADLSNHAITASGGSQEAYLTALRGVLAASGPKLTPATLSKAGAALQELVSSPGKEEGSLAAAARCMGPLACHCSAEELSSVVLSHALSVPASSQALRLGQALSLSAVALHAAPRLQEEGLLQQVVAAITKLSRDAEPEVRSAACRAAGALSSAEVEERLPRGAAVVPLMPVTTALLMPDQASDVQQQQMQVLRRLVVLNGHALDSHLGELVPLVCALLQSASGPTKLAAERTLARLLRADVGPETAQQFLAGGQGGSLARTYLTDSYLRRLGRLPLSDADDLELLD